MYHLNGILNALNYREENFTMWLPGIVGVVENFRFKVKLFTQSKLFENTIMICVIMNTIILALTGIVSETNASVVKLNLMFTITFTVEMGFKVIGYGWAGYVQDTMNIFDGAVTLLSMAELLFMSNSGSVSAFRTVRIFRTFRVLRVTRLIRSLEYLSIIIDVFAFTMESFVYMMLLMILFIYIYSLIGFQIYADQFTMRSRTHFDSFYFSFLAVFQVVTLENWNDILQSALSSSVNMAITIPYLIINIYLGNYIILNLFLAILLGGFYQLKTDDLGSDMVVHAEDGRLPDLGNIKNSTFKHKTLKEQ